MRPHLLKSFTTVLLFWWIVLLFSWAFDSTSKLTADLNALYAFYQGLTDFGLPDEPISVFNAWRGQLAILQWWTLPFLALTAAATLLGAGLAIVTARQYVVDRNRRETGEGEYQGLRVTKGHLPFPPTIPAAPVAFSHPSASYRQMDPLQKVLLTEVLSMLAGNPAAYVTDDEPDYPQGIYAHAVARLRLVLDAHPVGMPPLAIIGVGARYLGNLRGYKKNESGLWIKVGNTSPEKWAGLLLAQAPAFSRLSANARRSLVTALTYAGEEDSQIPIVWSDTPEVSAVAKEIVAYMAEASTLFAKAQAAAPSQPVRLESHTSSAATEPTVGASQVASHAPVLNLEKSEEPAPVTLPPAPPVAVGLSPATPAQVPQETRKPKSNSTDLEDELPEIAIRIFHEVLPFMPFQSMNGRRKQPAVGWKVGKRLYLIEIQVRERCLERLSDVARTRFEEGAAQSHGRVNFFSVQLMKAFARRGWLVTELNSVKLDPAEALWKVQAGIKDYKGIIVIDVPDDVLEHAPASDTNYAIEVLGPLFAPPIDAAPLSASAMSSLFSANGGQKQPGGVVRIKPAIRSSSPETAAVKEQPAASPVPEPMAPASSSAEISPSEPPVVTEPMDVAATPETPTPVLPAAVSAQPELPDERGAAGSDGVLAVPAVAVAPELLPVEKTLRPEVSPDKREAEPPAAERSAQKKPKPLLPKSSPIPGILSAPAPLRKK